MALLILKTFGSIGHFEPAVVGALGPDGAIEVLSASFLSAQPLRVHDG